MPETQLSSTLTQHTPFHFQKRNGPLFKLYLKTLLLSVVTLGIYSFWGKVSITKFIYNHLAFGKRSFDYHATGKERFIGFIKGLAILSFIFIIQTVLYRVSPLLGKVSGFLLLLFAIFYVGPFVVMGKWKYLLSRSSYCNVRFKFTGTFKEISSIWISGVLLTIVTLGFYNPVFQNKLYKYLIDNSRFGTLEFKYTGVNKEYFWIWLKGIILTVLTLGVYSFWFSAEINRYTLSNTSLDGKSFNSNITGGGLFKVGIVNVFIVVLTLGLGFPIALNRIYEYFFSNLTLDASPEKIETVAASFDTKASAFAGGIEEAADVVDAISGFF